MVVHVEENVKTTPYEGMVSLWASENDDAILGWLFGEIFTRPISKPGEVIKSGTGGQ